MKKQYYTVNDITKITGITRRTLHYYDEIGLLKAASLTPQGYRLYSKNDFERLQVILFFKEMNLPLKEIQHILQLPKQEQNNLLKKHYAILSNKKQKLEQLLINLEQYLSGRDIFDLIIFDNTDVLPIREQYSREANYLYGETEKYKEYERNIAQLTQDKKEEAFNKFESDMKRMFKLFAGQVKESPSSDKVQTLVYEWECCFQKFFVCDKEILKCIANAYKFDNRFRNYINQFSNDDLSDFIYQAIIQYCEHK